MILSEKSHSPSAPAASKRARLEASDVMTPLRRACIALGLPPDFPPPGQTDWIIKRMPGGKQRAIELLRNSPDERGLKLIEAYDTLAPAEQKAITLGYLIAATGSNAPALMGLIVTEDYRQTGSVALIRAIVSSPEAVRRAAKRALTPGGFRDANLVLQIAAMVKAR
jgi:hypothetical protein